MTAPDFAVTVTVAGVVPGPQGSKRHVGGGRMIESSKRVKPWREQVVLASKDAKPEDFQTLTGPLRADIVFSWQRPKGKLPADRGGRPITVPDLSKLLRSTEDALTTAEVWKDDALVVEYGRLAKVYTGSDDPDALERPGAVIRIWRLAPETVDA